MNDALLMPLRSVLSSKSPISSIRFTTPPSFVGLVPSSSSSACPKITPPVGLFASSRPSASSTSSRPSSPFVPAPMSSLKNTLAMPASSSRSLPSLVPVSAAELIDVSFVNSTSDPPVVVVTVSSVSMRTSLASVIAPFNRTSSDVVVIVSTSSVVFPVNSRLLFPPPFRTIEPMMPDSPTSRALAVVPSPTRVIAETSDVEPAPWSLSA